MCSAAKFTAARIIMRSLRNNNGMKNRFPQSEERISREERENCFPAFLRKEEKNDAER